MGIISIYLHIRKFIKQLNNLTHLDLCQNKKITDEGIKQFTNLTHIGLNYNNKITNEGIKLLTRLDKESLKIQIKYNTLWFIIQDLVK